MSPLHRIAFISSLGFGGATTFLCNLTGELARRNVPVIVVSPEIENSFASDFRQAGVQVFQHDHRRVIFEDRMAAMLGDLAAFQPSIVVACLGQTSYEILRYLPVGVGRLAVIQSDHQMFYDAVAPYVGCLDDVVGVSRKITERLEQMDAFRDVAKLCLLHGVAVPQTVAPRETGGQPLRILYLGRIMNPQKRVHLFPKILEDLKGCGIPFRWTIAGDGEARVGLERAMASNNPDQQITFPGSLPNAQVPALLEQHDIFLLASDAEGLPISLLEAMAHGLVPVVSDLESGIRDVVDETNGILVPVDDVAGYGRAIIHLHEHRDELAAKSAAAHERVKREFSVEAMTDRWLAALSKNLAVGTCCGASDPAAEHRQPATGAWPARWNIKPPLPARHPVYFSPPMRMLRRWATKLRN